MDGDFLGDSFLGEKLKELFFFAGAVATPPRATSQAWAAAWPLAWATCVGVSPFVAGASILRRSLCFPPATIGDGEHRHAVRTTNKTRGRCADGRQAL